MENYLLTLVNRKLPSQHQITNESIRRQMNLAGIDLEKISQDVASLLEMSNGRGTLSFDDIHGRQVGMNIRDEEILAYFQHKKYTNGSFSKIKDRTKLEKRLIEIHKLRSFDSRSFQRPLNSSESFEQDLNDICLKIDIRMSLASRYHCCRRDLKELIKILLKDMTVNRIHVGSFLECTVISKPIFIYCGLSFLVKDESDNQIENVLLHNYETRSVQIDPEILIPINTKLIIKEPYLQTMYTLENLKQHSNDKEEKKFLIRVESPTDVIVLKFGCNENKIDPIQDNHLAIRFFSDEIEKSKKLNQSYLKRSEAYLRLDKYYLAYQDAQKVAQLDEKNMKAFFLMGKASYNMRKFKQAQENFFNCLKLSTESLNSSDTQPDIGELYLT